MSKFRAQRYEDIWPGNVGKPRREKGDAHADMVSEGFETWYVDSCCRFVVSSFPCVTSLLCSVFSSTNSSRRLIAPLTSIRSLVCHSSRCFASLMFPFVVSLRLFDRASLWTRIGIIRPWITWSSWLTGKYDELVKEWRNWKPTSPRWYSAFSTAYTNSSKVKWAISLHILTEWYIFFYELLPHFTFPPSWKVCCRELVK